MKLVFQELGDLTNSMKELIDKVCRFRAVPERGLL